MPRERNPNGNGEVEQARLIRELEERNKELELLHEIAALGGDSSLSLEEFLEEVVALVPAAWQYPEEACGRIEVGDVVVSTDDYRRTEWRQEAAIVVGKEQVGTVEVCYLSSEPDRDEGPFFAEERALIESLARQIARIVERKRAQEALDRVNSELRSLGQMLDLAPASITIHDSGGNFLYANRKTVELHGYSSIEEFLGVRLKDLDVPASAERQDERFVAIFGEGGASFEVEHFRKDGSILPLHVVGKAIDWQGEEAVLSIATDIAERKRLDRILRESEARARAMYKWLPMPTFVWLRTDDGFVLDDFNAAADETIMGAASSWLGKTLEEVHGDRPDIIGDIERCFEERVSLQREMEFRYRSTGESRMIVATYGYVPPDMVLTHTEDITERRATEVRAMSSQRLEAIGQLAGGVAHDFNNVLTVIGSYTDFLMKGLDPSDPRLADLDQIRRAGERAANLTRQLLAFSRKQVLKPVVLDLNNLVVGIEEMLRKLIGEHIEIETRLDPDIDRVEADQGQIEQILMNLAVNARDAMPEGGALTLETGRVDLPEGVPEQEVEPGRYVTLAVSDTGIGMSAETLRHVFEPFFTTKEKGKGTGLGLATVYGIVRQSGGCVRVSSEEGRGSVFEVLLPAVTRPAADDDPVARSSSESGDATVLVVEDESAVREATGRILAEAGYRVLSAENGEEALRLCESVGDNVDLVLTDVVMPVMGGKELAARLADICPEKEVVFMSGYADDEVLRRNDGVPASRFVSKPFTKEELLSAIGMALDPERG